MLVLSRKLNESIIINGNIRVMVVGIRGNHVRLGIEAPGQVPIFREELCTFDQTDPDETNARRSRFAPTTVSATP